MDACWASASSSGGVPGPEPRSATSACCVSSEILFGPPHSLGRGWWCQGWRKLLAGSVSGAGGGREKARTVPTVTICMALGHVGSDRGQGLGSRLLDVKAVFFKLRPGQTKGGLTFISGWSPCKKKQNLKRKGSFFKRAKWESLSIQITSSEGGAGRGMGGLPQGTPYRCLDSERPVQSLWVMSGPSWLRGLT